MLQRWSAWSICCANHLNGVRHLLRAEEAVARLATRDQAQRGPGRDRYRDAADSTPVPGSTAHRAHKGQQEQTHRSGTGKSRGVEQVRLRSRCQAAVL
jgi:hypothetical protein